MGILHFIIFEAILNVLFTYLSKEEIGVLSLNLRVLWPLSEKLIVREALMRSYRERHRLTACSADHSSHPRSPARLLPAFSPCLTSGSRGSSSPWGPAGQGSRPVTPPGHTRRVQRRKRPSVGILFIQAYLIFR